MSLPLFSGRLPTLAGGARVGAGRDADQDALVARPARARSRTPGRRSPARPRRRPRVSSTSGTKPAPMPWILCGPGWPPREHRRVRRLDGHDAARSGLRSLSTSPTPVTVPPVPTPATKTSTLPSVSSQISSAVVRAVDLGVGGVLELLRHEARRRSRRRARAALAMAPRHALGPGREDELGAVGLEQRCAARRSSSRASSA